METWVTSEFGGDMEWGGTFLRGKKTTSTGDNMSNYTLKEDILEKCILNIWPSLLPVPVLDKLLSQETWSHAIIVWNLFAVLRKVDPETLRNGSWGKSQDERLQIKLELLLGVFQHCEEQNSGFWTL